MISRGGYIFSLMVQGLLTIHFWFVKGRSMFTCWIRWLSFPT